MQSIIGLLMLALSLLNGVQSNPSWPQPIKDQSTALAAQLFTEATAEMTQNTSTIGVGISTPAIDSAPAPATMAPMPETTPLVVYILKSEHGDGLQDFYYAGNKELSAISVNGADASTTLSKHLPNDSIMVDGQKITGYFVARIDAPTDGNDTFTLTAADGSVFQGGLTQ